MACQPLWLAEEPLEGRSWLWTFVSLLTFSQSPIPGQGFLSTWFIRNVFPRETDSKGAGKQDREEDAARKGAISDQVQADLWGALERQWHLKVCPIWSQGTAGLVHTCPRESLGMSVHRPSYGGEVGDGNPVAQRQSSEEGHRSVLGTQKLAEEQRMNRGVGQNISRVHTPSLLCSQKHWCQMGAQCLFVERISESVSKISYLCVLQCAQVDEKGRKLLVKKALVYFRDGAWTGRAGNPSDDGRRGLRCITDG